MVLLSEKNSSACLKKAAGCGNSGNKTISVAPMLGYTDRHCRYFYRLISPDVLLFTEMVTCNALIFGDVDRHLRFDEAQHPLALQLAGDSPKDFATCAGIAEKYGYDEININCGCPSERVQKGNFGACLMLLPEVVADCVKAIRNSTDIPVSIKCRIGVDDHDDYGFLRDFVGVTSESGCNRYVIHARKALLKGLSPKENRDIPPLRYDVAERIKKDFSRLHVVLNGGISDIEGIRNALGIFDGVMIGREIYKNPWFLHKIGKEVYGNNSDISRKSIALKMAEYVDRQEKEHGIEGKVITRHMLGLFYGVAGAKMWKNALVPSAEHKKITADSIRDALHKINLLNDLQK